MIEQDLKPVSDFWSRALCPRPHLPAGSSLADKALVLPGALPRLRGRRQLWFVGAQEEEGPGSSLFCSSLQESPLWRSLRVKRHFSGDFDQLLCSFPECSLCFFLGGVGWGWVVCLSYRDSPSPLREFQISQRCKAGQFCSIPNTYEG